MAYLFMENANFIIFDFWVFRFIVVILTWQVLLYWMDLKQVLDKFWLSYFKNVLI